MKIFWTILTLLVLSSCQNSDNDLLSGKWKVSTRAFHAVYQIEKGTDGYDCRVVSYNDGTTVYSENSSTKPYIFKNWNATSDSQIDGSTGATKKSKSKSNMHEIRVLDKNQLEVTSKVLNQKKVEKWIRVQ